jgi:hypothetical protein
VPARDSDLPPPFEAISAPEPARLTRFAVEVRAGQVFVDVKRNA